ncbi:MAG: GNAT family N-acetyltransferase [Nitrospirota bacterium]
MARYIIREADQNDISGIIRLRHTIRVFRSIETAEYDSFWNSLISSNPSSIRHIFVGVNEKKEIVAHVAMVPFRFLRDGEPLIGGLLCQLMVHEAFRQELLFPRLEMKILSGYQARGFDFSFILANRGDVKKAHISLGFHDIGDLVVYAMPYKLSGITRRVIKNGLLNSIMMPIRFIAEGLLRLKRSSGKCASSATEISRFDSSIDQFLVEVQKYFPYTAVRNSAILNWRFSNDNSMKYQILVIKEDSEIVGYVVLRRIDMKGFDVLAIADILFSPARIDVGRSLINAVHRKAVQLGVEMSACLLNPNDPLCSIIRKCGYIKTPEVFSLIVHEPKDKTRHFGKDTFAKWHLTWFDHDVV